MRDSCDRELGLNRKITRRDFLNGAALTVGASVLPANALAAFGFPVTEFPGTEFQDTDSQDNDFQDAASQKNASGQSHGYYPPALTGLRGSHIGSFETAHSLRDGTFWEHAGQPIETGETYDLVVVGGGISGLSAAHFFRKAAGSKARVLILENHDDFGGHAKRNEFSAPGRMLLGYGGTYSIESPAPYSAVSKALIKELGIDVSSYSRHVSQDLYSSFGLTRSIFFDKETFGSDKLVPDPAPLGWGATECCSPADSGRWK